MREKARLLKAVMPDGEVITRKTTHAYTHVVICPKHYAGWKALQWTTQPKTAFQKWQASRHNVQLVEVSAGIVVEEMSLAADFPASYSVREIAKALGVSPRGYLVQAVVIDRIDKMSGHEQLHAALYAIRFSYNTAGLPNFVLIGIETLSPYNYLKLIVDFANTGKTHTQAAEWLLKRFAVKPLNAGYKILTNDAPITWEFEDTCKSYREAFKLLEIKLRIATDASYSENWPLDEIKDPLSMHPVLGRFELVHSGAWAVIVPADYLSDEEYQAMQMHNADYLELRREWERGAYAEFFGTNDGGQPITKKTSVQPFGDNAPEAELPEGYFQWEAEHPGGSMDEYMQFVDSGSDFPAANNSMGIHAGDVFYNPALRENCIVHYFSEDGSQARVSTEDDQNALDWYSVLDIINTWKPVAGMIYQPYELPQRLAEFRERLLWRLDWVSIDLENAVTVINHARAFDYEQSHKGKSLRGNNAPIVTISQGSGDGFGMGAVIHWVWEGCGIEKTPHNNSREQADRMLELLRAAGYRGHFDFIAGQNFEMRVMSHLFEGLHGLTPFSPEIPLSIPKGFEVIPTSKGETLTLTDEGNKAYLRGIAQAAEQLPSMESLAGPDGEVRGKLRYDAGHVTFLLKVLPQRITDESPSHFCVGNHPYSYSYHDEAVLTRIGWQASLYDALYPNRADWPRMIELIGRVMVWEKTTREKRAEFQKPLRDALKQQLSALSVRALMLVDDNSIEHIVNFDAHGYVMSSEDLQGEDAIKVFVTDDMDTMLAKMWNLGSSWDEL